MDLWNVGDWGKLKLILSYDIITKRCLFEGTKNLVVPRGLVVVSLGLAFRVLQYNSHTVLWIQHQAWSLPPMAAAMEHYTEKALRKGIVLWLTSLKIITNSQVYTSLSLQTDFIYSESFQHVTLTQRHESRIKQKPSTNGCSNGEYNREGIKKGHCGLTLVSSKIITNSLFYTTLSLQTYLVYSESLQHATQRRESSIKQKAFQQWLQQWRILQRRYQQKALWSQACVMKAADKWKLCVHVARLDRLCEMHKTRRMIQGQRGKM